MNCNKPVPETEAHIRVGILCARTIEVIWNDYYRNEDREYKPGDALRFEAQAMSQETVRVYLPTSPEATFTIKDVIIGVNFHWQRAEDQTFRGALEVRRSESGEELWAINIVPIEDYLMSVISSEMKSTAHPEFLKAHAVISRGWVLSQIGAKTHVSSASCGMISDSERIVWYDHADHQYFDVCADDHCQRYQGLTREITDVARSVVTQTTGEILSYEGRICDTRFSKCCGGAMETFDTCWQDEEHPYLQAKRDDPQGQDIDLSAEDDAVSWILSLPQAYCRTEDTEILSQVLNDYDLETSDFYRWSVTYTQQELSDLLRERSGIDFGLITDLKPLARGHSGRIWKLRITGTLRTMVVGKELEIRRYLSPSHLYSSAFVVERKQERGQTLFVLRGAGWGHGVGLCQIGAAVMSYEGKTYREILAHYYPHSVLTTYMSLNQSKK